MSSNNASCNKEFFDSNIGVIENRWPAICQVVTSAAPIADVEVIDDMPQKTLFINGVHLSSLYDREKEAKLQSDVVSENNESVWIYGVGTGDLIRELLKRERLKEVNVVMMNPSVFQSSMQYFDHQDWLSDERVNLFVAENQTDINTPFVTVPACLKLVDDTSARLRDLLVLELETGFINRKVRNNKELVQQIENNIDLISQDSDVADLFNTLPGVRALVVAAGPSLNHHFDRLKTRDVNNTVLVCVDAAIKPLLLHGVVPDLVVTVDAHRDGVSAMLDVDMSLLSKTPLIYLPTVYKDVLVSWSGPRYVCYSASPLFDHLRYSLPRGELFLSGTVLHAAVDAVIKMGVSRVELYGADFSYPGGESHATGAAHNQTHLVDVAREWVINGYGEKVVTSKNMRGYLRDLERYIEVHPEVEFVNTSRDGALIKGAVIEELKEQ